MKTVMENQESKGIGAADSAITIFFTRDSFCMGDDCTAPNLKKYEWEYYYSESSIFSMLLEYLYPGMPSFHWRGYCNGKTMVDVYCAKEDKLTYSYRIILADNWKEKLEEFKAVEFMHTDIADSELLPEEIQQYYTFNKAEENYRAHHRN